MYQAYLMEFPYKQHKGLEPNPKQRVITFDELNNGRYWGYEFALDKWCVCTMSVNQVNDMLSQGSAVRLI